MGEVRQLYDVFGINLTPQVESPMTDYINNDPRKNVYGKHVYKKGNSFSREFIEKEFKEYIELMSNELNGKISYERRVHLENWVNVLYWTILN